ncbi:MAG: siphovirus Gp157 family protein [Mogibacterium sp.]|nr:siphovirus Gp157 family protein [Mogibacterium sp.]MBR6821944.1 siphovirus Gp157 family protein [Clostridia bacterium]
MATLFDIVGEFQRLYDMGTDPECDEQIFSDTLESLVGELEVKGAGYVSVIKQLEMEAKQADEVAKAFADKKKVRENHIKRMKDALKQAMEQTGQEQISAGDFTIKLQKNGGLAPLAITGEVPQNMTKVVVEPDQTKIREYLKDNECEWAHLEERGTHVVIK